MVIRLLSSQGQILGYHRGMITKLLLTITVIVGVILFLRLKSHFKGENRATALPGAAAKSAEASEKEKMFRQGAWLFMILMGISAVVMVVYRVVGRSRAAADQFRVI